MAEIGAIALVMVLYALVAGSLRNSPVTAPMVFVGAGLLFGWAGLGGVAGLADAGDVGGLLEASESALMLANITLSILLFANARRIDVRRLRRDIPLAARLLGLGLPLTIGLGGLLAFAVLDGLEPWEAMLLAAIVAPTDLALGQAVIADERVPARIRDALDLEGGLNDGLALPFFTVFAALAVDAADLGRAPLVTALAEKLGYGIAVGLAVGVVGGLLLQAAVRRGLSEPLWGQLGLIALAVVAWWASEELHGSGFIGAFVAGAVCAWTTRGVGDGEQAVEGLSETLMLAVFFLVGASGATALEFVTWEIVVYAVLALTVIRAVPVALATIGAGLDLASVAFVAWFGPRGLATVVFALLAITEAPQLAGIQTIMVAAMLTVLLSVFAHGLTAAPLSARFARRAAARRPS